MGDCMSKLHKSRSIQSNQTIISGNGLNTKISEVTANDQFDTLVPSKRQIKYWTRRLYTIKNLSTNEVQEDEMAKFFSYTDLSKETIRNLYEYFKNNAPILSNQAFISGLKRFVQFSDNQLAAVIYYLYFSKPINSGIQFQKFQQQFTNFIKGKNQPASVNLRISNSNKQNTANMNQFKIILSQRKSIQDRQKCIKWLTKNVNFRNFKLFFLQEGLKQDEMIAYKSFIIDYNIIQNKFVKQPTNVQQQVSIINWRWCEKALRYMQQKYQVQGTQSKLKRRPTIDADSIYYQTQKKMRKQSIDMRKSSINENLPTLQNQSSSYAYRSTIGRKSSEMGLPVIHNNMNFDSSMVNVKQKEIGSGLQFKNYPGQIDNYALVGNFSWQLKRNIRKDVDYVTIKQKTFDKLLLAFGGGPVLKRKLIKGYIELRPYFVLTSQLVYDPNTRISKLVQTKLQRISSNQTLSNFNPNIPKKSICYHKNIGGQLWLSYPSTFDLNQKIMDILSQTSFLIYMLPQNQPYFKQIYMQSSEKPRLGEMYESKSYKILESVQQRILNDEKISVCIIDDQQNEFTQFVVLNWSHNIQRRMPLNQFKQHFVQAKNIYMITTMAKKNRVGISNLGNTCYMNSVVQGLISLFKQQDLKFLKGQMGNQLKVLSKMVRQKKKSVSPFDFKTCFDKKADYFRGQQQHDAHEFAMTLIDQLEQNNKQFIKSNFQSKINIRDKCSKCQKIQQIVQPCYLISLPLRDFARKEVKIDYITDNRNIQTVIFQIDEQSTVLGWKKEFEKATGAKDYFLCEVQNSLIRKTFNKDDNIDSLPYKQLGIQNHFLITAYQTQSFQSKYVFKKKTFEFRTYKNSRGELQIARVEEKIVESGPKSTNDLETSIQKPITPKFKVKLKMPDNTFQQRLVNEAQLLRFPQDYPQKQQYVKVNNFDNSFNQNIGRPLLLKINNTYTLKAVRQAIQFYIGKKGYIIRLSTPNQYYRCQICYKYNDFSSECFLSKQATAPIGWIYGYFEFVVVWQDAKQYHNIVKRTKFLPLVQNGETKDSSKQYDNFQMSLKTSQKPQILQVDQCNLCKSKNVEYQRKEQIIKWPTKLIIHLKRFAVKNNQISKIHTKWKLQQILYIQQNKYILQSVLCHIGTTADFGHYITISNGACYDDELVTQMSYQAVKPQQIFMLFYEKAQS